MNRLRQSNQLKSGSMSGIAVGNFPWIKPQYWNNKIPILRGTIQVTFDQFEKWPWNPYWRYRSMLPLNEVLMSKVEFVTPRQVQKVTAKYFSQTFGLSGDNVGGLAHSATGWYLCPPQDAEHLPFVYVDSKQASYLLQRAYSKMSSAKYDFGVSIGEIHETASMLAGPLRGIVKLTNTAFAGIAAVYQYGGKVAVQAARNATAKQLRSIKNNTVQHPTKTSLRIIDESANHWLAYKFGVCPFIADVNKAIEFAKENVGPLMGLQVARVKGWKDDTTVVRPSYRFSLCGAQLPFDAFGTVRTIDQHHTGIYFRNEITAPLVNFLETIGFSPFQLPSLAYELVPLSFVVDRFIDIKSFVRGNIGSLSKQTFGTYTTRKVETIWSQSLVPVPYGTGLIAKVDTFPSSHARMQQMARAVNLERPKFPVINPRWLEMLTADATNLSLIWGRLRTYVGK